MEEALEHCQRCLALVQRHHVALRRQRAQLSRPSSGHQSEISQARASRTALNTFTNDSGPCARALPATAPPTVQLRSGAARNCACWDQGISLTHFQLPM